jgi:hypothetical protein
VGRRAGKSSSVSVTEQEAESALVGTPAHVAKPLGLTRVCLPTVDCWDGPDGEPIVHHGYTLTSKILFKDVIETINKFAFIKNE